MKKMISKIDSETLIGFLDIIDWKIEMAVIINISY